MVSKRKVDNVSNFLRISCECGEPRVVFGDSKLAVVCAKCKNPLVLPQGGRAKILAKILEVFA